MLSNGAANVAGGPHTVPRLGKLRTKSAELGIAVPDCNGDVGQELYHYVTSSLFEASVMVERAMAEIGDASLRERLAAVHNQLRFCSEAVTAYSDQSR